MDKSGPQRGANRPSRVSMDTNQDKQQAQARPVHRARERRQQGAPEPEQGRSRLPGASAAPRQAMEQPPAVRSAHLAARAMAMGALSRGAFAELQNALCAILGYAQLIAPEMEPTSDSARSLRRLTHAGRHGAWLLTRLAAFLDREPRGAATWPLTGRLDDAVAMVRPLLRARCHLRVQHTARDIQIHADETHLEGLFVSALLYVTDGLAPGTRVTVFSERVQEPEAYGLPVCSAWTAVRFLPGVPLASPPSHGLSVLPDDLAPVASLASELGGTVRALPGAGGISGIVCLLPTL